MLVASYLVQFLKSQGVTHVFGLPGGENVLVLETLRQEGVDFVLVHHEAAAGFAADVTGQLTGRPGVCLSTVGPGAMNLLATAVAATQERSPLLAITADIDLNLQPRITHMYADLTSLFQVGTKGSFHLTPETAAHDLHQAWLLAQTPPRGAVHLALSASVAASPIIIQPRPFQSPPNTPFDPDKMETLKTFIQQANSIFLLAGLGLEAAEAQAELLELVEAWQTPVAVTPKAKGHFPENHPLFAGCFTAYGDQPLRKAFAESDLILGIGLDGVDLATSTWDIATPVVNLAMAGADDPVFRPVMAMDGDVKQMLTTIHSWRQPYLHGPTQAADLRTAVTEALTTHFPETSGGIKLHDLITALASVMPPHGAVTLDVGAFKLVFLQQWRSNLPKSLFVSNGLSAMGYAVPGALALKLAQPDRPVVAVVGDGALLMYAGELATVSRLESSLLILVIVDKALALIRLKQLRQDTPVYGTEFGRTDYAALAAAFGLGYQLIESKGNASRILDDALQQERPVLVEARIHKEEYDHFK